jgi:hypothetical protein
MGMDKEELVRNLNGYAAWPCAQAKTYAVNTKHLKTLWTDKSYLSIFVLL